MNKYIEAAADKLRMSQWLVISVALYLVAPVLAAFGMAQLSTVVWKVGHITVGAHLGYWIAREAFKRSLSTASVECLAYCRALIIGCAVLAVALGM